MSTGAKGGDPILIVEDDEATAELERRSLVRAGRTVRVAAGVAEAVALLRSERFGAVLLDYKLPEGMGWPVLEAARSLVPRVPVVIVTAAGDERVAAEAIRRGAADYLVKTGDFTEQLPDVVELAFKLAEADDANARLAALVESSEDAITSATADGILASWNPGAEVLYGYPAVEAIGRHVSMLVPPERGSENDDVLARIRRGEAIKNFETVRLRKDGTRVDVSLTVSAMRDRSGRLVGAAAIARDISERLRGEAQLLRAKEAAEAAVKAKGEFLANVSHELRTPMNGVLGMTSLLLDTELSPEQREHVETIRWSGNALLTIVNDILDYSKIEAGALELLYQSFSVRRCIEESLDLVAVQTAAKELDLCADIDERVPVSLLGDATRLRQVLVNLVGNAAKFTEKGEVVVAMAPAASLPDDPTPRWTLVVRDTGIGIPDDRLDRLFRPFSQVDAGIARKYGGTGLGLAITKRLVERMGGELTVTSVVGRGSSFSFTLPAATSDMESEPPSRDLTPLFNKRILIVDDNATSRRLLCAQAARWGMRPNGVASAREALALFGTEARRPPCDVAVFDGAMPEMDGFQLVRAVRRLHSAEVLPVVMLTSINEVTLRRDADRHDCAAFVAKPVKLSSLRDALIGALSGGPRAALDPSAKLFDAELAARHPLRILLAEDNSVNQRVAVQMLKRLGYRADIAANGLEALEALERQAYDVVLMDVQMPELDGLSATRELRRRWKGRKRPQIVAMTANAMREDREECLSAGMDDYIAKPLSVRDLVTALRRAWEAVEAAGEAVAPHR